MRAAHAALVLGLIGGLWLATMVLSMAGHPSLTVADALGLEAADPADLDARRAGAVAVLTAECMRMAGLAWLPVPEPVPQAPDPDLGPVEWADRWGFGISTAPHDLDATPAPDPNLAALARLSGAAWTAYQTTLQGNDAHPGCRQRSNDAVYGLRDRLLRPLRAELDRLEAAIGADPAMATALAVWRGCVATVSAGLAIDRRTLPGALVDRFAARAAAVTPGSVEQRRLQRDERLAAGAVARCEDAYTAARARAAARHEAAFVAAHSEQLHEIGAAIRAAEAALPTLPP